MKRTLPLVVVLWMTLASRASEPTHPPLFDTHLTLGGASVDLPMFLQTSQRKHLEQRWRFQNDTLLKGFAIRSARDQPTAIGGKSQVAIGIGDQLRESIAELTKVIVTQEQSAALANNLINAVRTNDTDKLKPWLYGPYDQLRVIQKPTPR
jgi:hypothetical protein